MIKESAIEAVFERSLKLKPGEKCLVVTDTVKESLGEAFFDYAGKITDLANMVVMDPTDEHAAEPPEEIASMMLEYDVEIFITEKSLTHTSARRGATAAGARIATMPSITREIADRCLDIDYDMLRERSIRVSGLLEKSGTVRVVTKRGTDISMDITKGRLFGKEGGVFDKPGDYGNLPEGEVAFAPGRAEGVFIVDASMAGLGMLDEPLTFTVEDNIVRSISGRRSEELIKRLDSVGIKAYVLAELGIGLNPKATIIGNILEDEKVIGTVHFALGNNCSFGGVNDVPLHLDGVLKDPDIFLDGTMIMQEGRFLE